MRELELLSPAANKEIAKEAIIHGADAIYIGGPSHGARSKATNSLEDIAEIVEFAHLFRARVYVTVNTIIYENELEKVESLIWDLYRIGVDALIAQDMGILRMKLPPIELHASTQCDTRTMAKARFLEDVGFSQIVLARELSLNEIKKICESVKVPVECFIHGALCVSYSGRCQASQLCTGRSANRGECSQMCRMKYTLVNNRGEELIRNRYLLSLSDFNASDHIDRLIEAGVRSFKIEGRMKDVDYVKNVTSFYRKIIDEYISSHSEEYCRSSFGRSDVSFTPSLQKSFNRGFTDYFLNGRGDRKMASLFTPKSLGERITSLRELNNGDGIGFFNSSTGEYEGVRVNRIDGNRIIGTRPIKLSPDTKIYRTFDQKWQKDLAGKTGERKIWVDIKLDESGVWACDERGCKIRLALDCKKEVAKKPMQIRHIFEKTGGTIYELRNFENQLLPTTFIPASELSNLKRLIFKTLDTANQATYCFGYRKKEEESARFPYSKLTSLDNVSNSLAEKFYIDHGVKEIEKAVEVMPSGKIKEKEQTVMTTRYCIRRELGCCKKYPKDKKLYSQMKEPLSIISGPNRFRLEFDCANCEMKVKL